MFRPVLCAVDESSEACGAVEVAAALAGRLNVPLILAHVLPPTFPRGSELEFEPPADAAWKAADKLLRHVASNCARNTEPRLRLAFGDIADKLEALADEEEARLLVLGSRGRGGLKDALLGGISSRLPARSQRPVLVVPPGGAREFRLCLSERAPSVVCAIDGSEAAQVAASHGAEIARALGLRVVLIHVHGDRPLATRPATVGAIPLYGADALEAEQRFGRHVLDRAADLIPSEVEVSVELVAGDPPSALARRAARECAAVIAVGSRGRGPLRSLLLGSTSRRLAGCTDRPVLVASTTVRPPRGERPAVEELTASAGS